jgi:nitrogen regulatory protein PII-like uncharacterized protein
MGKPYDWKEMVNGEDGDNTLEEIADQLAEAVPMSSLMVNIDDFIKLYDRFGEEKAWEILTRLKHLLG